MAKPIQTIRNIEPTQEQQQRQELEKLLAEMKKNQDGLTDTLMLLQELHKIGVLGAANAALQAKEKIANIVMGQVLRPNVTNLVNHAMGAAGALGEIDPSATKKLLGGVGKGLERAAQGLENEEKTGVFDLMKALKDPDINRAITFGLNLMKGLGEGMKEEE
jgi:uncharacterized protein YjgD (DUF1641 family)